MSKKNEISERKIGLALSGGGSRAIAFHLGCLRALNQLGLLQHIDVLSTVSGGSVIGACYLAHDGDFASFEARIRKLLAGGLAKPMAKRLFSFLGLKIVAAFVMIGLVAACIFIFKLLVTAASFIVPVVGYPRSSSGSKSDHRCIASPAARTCCRLRLMTCFSGGSRSGRCRRNLI